MDRNRIENIASSHAGILYKEYKRGHYGKKGDVLYRRVSTLVLVYRRVSTLVLVVQAGLVH